MGRRVRERGGFQPGVRARRRIRSSRRSPGWQPIGVGVDWWRLVRVAVLKESARGSTRHLVFSPVVVDESALDSPSRPVITRARRWVRWQLPRGAGASVGRMVVAATSPITVLEQPADAARDSVVENHY